ncbi:MULTISPECIES: hypothetical protein [Pseudomonas]|uniref:Flagellar basal body protein n=1 Tax=Pseudomonas luteola TaxID=47886 RepID=A0ABS0FPI3_PSELU|nr:MULTISPECIES: hypothetical protein [Pseudomonas]MBF8642249.1 hypothetical protein [Pseudomonas zeshuii]RRW48364.1 hypothetical protein EGJ50_10430 [Pseudomonas luteola]SHJ24887.1 hypothetical protein SAMN05216295_109247 [Pseudomonas zeshuii]
MAFNTRNPVGSTDPRDLYDNAANFDKLANGVDPFYTDRLGKLRHSFAGMEEDFNNAQDGRQEAFEDGEKQRNTAFYSGENQRNTAFTLSQQSQEDRFQAFLESSGYQDLGIYKAGIVLDALNKTFSYNGFYYHLKGGVALPYTTTGVWADESENFVLLGDDILRQDIASTSGNKGAYITGYRSRTVGARLDDSPSAKDYTSSGLAALLDTPTLVVMPDGYQNAALPDTYDALLDYTGQKVPLLNPYGEDGISDLMQVKRLMRGQIEASHVGSSRGVVGIEGYARGSGANGPGNADYALMMTLQKKGFSDGTAAVGEIDGMQMVIRQGGKDSDVCAGLFNVAHYGTGFNAIFEGQTSRIDPANSTITKQMQTQIGLVGNSEADKNGIAVGFHAVANTGVLDEGIRISDAGGVWNYFFRGVRGGVTTFLVDSYGQMTLADATGNTKTIGVDQNSFRILNHAKDKQLLVLADTGLMTLNGQMVAAEYRVNNVKVVGGRDTGWGAMTGTASKAAITTYEPTAAASTYTQTQMQNLMTAVQVLSRRVMAMDSMLRTHGLTD